MTATLLAGFLLLLFLDTKKKQEKSRLGRKLRTKY
jgi:hypothetical protein